VIDTSVYISALLSPAGTSRKAVDRAFDRCIVVSSEEAIFELQTKLYSVKFRKVLATEDIEPFLDLLVQRVEFFVRTVFQTRSRDPNDDIFLDLAETVGAAYLITGDKDLLSLADRHGVPGLRIVQPAVFLELA
jgi:putative PIN family toxin of toxin-antitoxin system